ncbi:MAG: NAD(P)/FAD-dependent oxidoreductase [Planctomycetes bacterium]|nr:NAD(P)/FAD-dependent oxidoreductase [Planctomycetota bacterium]
MTHSTIIVGSGISGLSAAIVLAKHGRTPLVLEAHNVPGGCMQMFQRRGPQGACRFDTGVHYVGSLSPGQTMWRLFRYLGVDVPTVPLDRECFDRISLPSGDFCVPVGWDKVEAALKRECPAEAAKIELYVAKMVRVEASLNWHSLNPDAEGAYDRELFETSLEAYLQGLGASARLRSLICAQSSLYAVRAAEVPLAIHAAVVGSAVEGPHYVEGGGDAITKPLVSRLQELGGELRVRAPVARVLVEGDRTTGVELVNGEVLEAGEVILAVHPRVAVKLLPEDAYRSALRKRMANAEECIGAFVVYGTVDPAADLTDVGGHNHYLLREDDPDCFYDPQLQGPADAIVNLPPPMSGPQLFSALGSARWEWFEKWENSRTLRRDAEYGALKDRLTSNIIAMVVQRIPQLRGHINVIDASTPLTLRDYAGYPRGGVYGMQPGLSAQGRNGVRRRTRYAGLYVTGAGTGTPGIFGACVTGFGVAGAILGTDALINEVREATHPA